MGNSNYSYNQIIDFLFPIWMSLLVASFIIGVVYVFKSISTERNKSPICCTNENHKHKYNYYPKINFWVFSSLIFSLIFFIGSNYLLWGKLSFDLKIYFAHYLFEDDNVGIAYGNFVGFILDVIIFFGLPLTTIILSFALPVKITKELLNFKKI
ncbi:MAG: hypothetical protein CL907_01850 [Dehalococcoidia bacterium]|nr:hypothetical protein [Dehalococcoidia bacterium]|tara:strand:+ start:745 stop:1206 length:462 start_codon:yes stop_codon:yes gene_type:complete